jgi:mediator of RNA polymerase II transcription subunit 31
MSTSSPPSSPKLTIPPPPSPPTNPTTSPLYAGYTRFELELEVPLPPAPFPSPNFTLSLFSKIQQFVTLLSSPLYLNHLATQKLLSQPAFIAYLAYLRYWSQPPYVTFLRYPGPTLKMLELLQVERFRREVLGPGVVGALVGGMVAGRDDAA